MHNVILYVATMFKNIFFSCWDFISTRTNVPFCHSAPPSLKFYFFYRSLWRSGLVWFKVGQMSVAGSSAVDTNIPMFVWPVGLLLQIKKIFDSICFVCLSRWCFFLSYPSLKISTINPFTCINKYNCLMPGDML